MVEPVAQQFGFACTTGGDELEDTGGGVCPSVGEELQFGGASEEAAFDGGEAVGVDKNWRISIRGWHGTEFSQRRRNVFSLPRQHTVQLVVITG